MGQAVLGPAADTSTPRVADEPVNDVELPFRQHLALANLRPPHDELEHAFVLRRLPDRLESSVQFLRRQVPQSSLLMPRVPQYFAAIRLIVLTLRNVASVFSSFSTTAYEIVDSANPLRARQ